MKPIRNLLAASAWMLLQALPSAACAANYYVASNGTPDNSGPGTKQQPWGNLSKVFSDHILRGGDVVTVLDTYVVTQRIKIVENPGASITLRGEPRVQGGEYKLDCRVQRARPEDPTPDCISIEGSSRIRLSGLTIDGAGTPDGSLIHIQAGSRDIQVSGNRLRNGKVYAVHVEGRRNTDLSVVVDNNDIRDNVNTAVYVMLGNTVSISGNAIQNVTNGDGIVVVETVGATIAGNTVKSVRKVTADGKGKDGIKARPSENLTIERNWVEDIAGSAIYLAGPYNWAVRTRHANVKVLDNTVTKAVMLNEYTGTPRCQGFGWPSALNVSQTDGVLIQGNHVFQNFGEGITLNDATRGTLVQNNSHDNFGVNLYLNNASNSTVDRNQAINDPALTAFYRCGAPAGGIGLANEKAEYDNYKPLSALSISNNLAINGRFGINFYWEPTDHYQPIDKTGLQNVNILNNTVYRTWENALAIVDTRNHLGNAIQSNIWVSRDSTWPVAKVPTVGFDCMSNLWWASTAVPSSCVHPSDIFADPQFVHAGGAATADYQLTSGSPAIDVAGYTVPVPFVWHDFFGNKRALGAWDMGAHELKK
ncbi:right-handed parallel beta-helix repeat-containing protein [Ideonella sp. DXS29W]|uniref:Right-handed parallel beta-helix repeat-containing protein n=1 Tax=Ideonella lacteola TaxID=2984193 RepID=A0ABU9BI16_9BURK